MTAATSFSECCLFPSGPCPLQLNMTSQRPTPWQSQLASQLEVACLLEATARKAGNVHPAAAFNDLTYHDFVFAAAASAPWLARAAELGIGAVIEQAVMATRQVCRSNVNLGLCLLLAPLAAVPQEQSLSSAIRRTVLTTTQADAAAVYRAIRRASAGGLGEVSTADVQSEPDRTLWQAMRLAADRDTIAAEYTRGFRRLRRRTVPWFLEELAEAERLVQPTAFSGQLDSVPPWERAVVRLHVRMIAAGDETLIARKCGVEQAQEAQRWAQACLRDCPSLTTDGAFGLDADRLRQFDQWLRADGHRRNPGTTADLVAATLFWTIREGCWTPPSRDAVLQHAAVIGGRVPL
jgi:triphosphoribosyl-dephospho-CoA synthase